MKTSIDRNNKIIKQRIKLKYSKKINKRYKIIK